jgi:hypothetical protein
VQRNLKVPRRRNFLLVDSPGPMGEFLLQFELHDVTVWLRLVGLLQTIRSPLLMVRDVGLQTDCPSCSAARMREVAAVDASGTHTRLRASTKHTTTRRNTARPPRLPRTDPQLLVVLRTRMAQGLPHR